jgi:hypothetical protein
MRALSLYQPWASLLVYGYKRIETRSWSTTYRGILLIHASQTKRWMPDFPRLLHSAGLPDAMTDLPTPFGAVLGSVEVVDCRKSEEFSESDVGTQEMALGHFSPGRYGWVLRNPVVFTTPIPCKGMLRLWEVPLAMLQQIDGDVSCDGGVCHGSCRGL